ncbi:MAG: hypothetical protein AAB538_04340, partial [Patescibacteria group bacterium]
MAKSVLGELGNKMKVALVGTVKGADELYDTLFEAVRGNVVAFLTGTGDVAKAGMGGGDFSSYMPSTSLFFPKRLQGTALGIQAGIGNFGVSLAQFL